MNIYNTYFYFFAKEEDFAASFDPETNMIKHVWKKEKFLQNAWPANILNLKVTHPLISSAQYALTLFRSNDNEKIKTAIKITQILLDCQYKDSSLPYYGVWPHNMEDDISRINTIDYGTVIHIGFPLFIILSLFSEYLCAEMIEDIKNALMLACFQILHLYTQPQHTHIILSEAFLSSACGEKFGSRELLDHGITTLKQFYYYTIVQGGFYKYNASYDDMYIVQLIHVMYYFIKNPAFLQILDKINDYQWGIIAHHYHFQTGQFCGPFSGYIDNFLTDDFKEFYKIACSPKTNSDNPFNFSGCCPKKYLKYFWGQHVEEYSQNIIHRGFSYPFYAFCQTSTTYIKPKYSLGTFNRSICWAGVCPFFATFGSRQSPYNIRMHILNNHVDLACAQFSCAQYKNFAVGHISFADDRLAAYPEYTENGYIKSSDLRIRVACLGKISELNIKRQGKKIDIQYGNIFIHFEYSYAKFDDFKIRPELFVSDSSCFLDLIIYHGQSRKIDFKKLSIAAVSWGFYISESNIDDFIITNKKDGKYLTSNYKTAYNTELACKSLLKPDSFANVHNKNLQLIQNIPLEKYALDKTNLVEQYSNAMNVGFESSLEIKINNIDINNLMQGLARTEEENLIPEIKNIFSIIHKNGLNLHLSQRLAIQILSQAFDIYKNSNIQFEIIIHNLEKTAWLQISSSNDLEAISYYTFKILNSLHEEYLRLSKFSDDREIINNVISIINKEYASADLSLSYIADRQKISVYSLSRIFKKYTGVNYVDYLSQIRVNNAKDLLKDTDLKISEIAKKVGYINSVYSFIRIFKKFTKATPSEYRKKIRI